MMAAFHSWSDARVRKRRRSYLSIPRFPAKRATLLLYALAWFAANWKFTTISSPQLGEASFDASQQRSNGAFSPDLDPAKPAEFNSLSSPRSDRTVVNHGHF